MGRLTGPAVARAMKVQEVSLRAASEQPRWWQAAETLESATDTRRGCGREGP